MRKSIIAICYDFDKTLSTDDMQNYSFIPNLKMTPSEFWSKSNRIARENKMDGILGYLKSMIDECKEKRIKLTKEYLNSLGKDVVFFNGVEDWFDRINKYGEEKDVEVEHYIISSGNKEIIEGTSIANKFKAIYGCEFLYNEKGYAFWPKSIVNYTQKTQFLFRISKGVYDVTDGVKINQRTRRHHVEFRNMIYMGDGLTDVPCMTLVKEKGGNSISIYTENSKENSLRLIKENRVNYACIGDFSEGSQVDNLVKLIIDSVSVKAKLHNSEKRLPQ